MPAVPAAYGLAVEGDVDVIGAAPAERGSLPGRVQVSFSGAPDEGEAAGVLFRQPGPDGQEAVRLERYPAGYRMTIARFASFGMSEDGALLVCRPEVDEEWRWQRALAANALPMAALLQGLEVLHAGAVAMDVGGREAAVVIAAGSHGGKSSLSINLALRGARLLTDDALAVRLTPDGEPLAYPGLAAASIRTAEVERLRELGLYERLHVIAEAPDGVRVLVDRASRPVPIAAIYWPERDTTASEATFAPIPPDPRRVLTGTINLALRDPERLRRHFETSTAIAATVPQIRVGVPPGVGAAPLAEAIERHAQALR